MGSRAHILLQSSSKPSSDNAKPAQPSLTETPKPDCHTNISSKIMGKTFSTLLSELYAKPLSERHVESDGLVFDPAQIIKRTANGVAVPHGDHYHFIPYSQMSPLEEKIGSYDSCQGTKWQCLAKRHSTEASAYYQTSSVSGK